MKKKRLYIAIYKAIQKMINFDNVTKKYIKKYKPNWSNIADPQYKILNLGGSGSGKKNSLFYLINHQTAIDKVSLYAKDPYEEKY